MKFRVKISLCMLGIFSLLFGFQGTLLITASFQNSIAREKDIAYSAYQSMLGTLQVVKGIEGTVSSLSDTLEQLYRQNAVSGAGFCLTSRQQTLYQTGTAKALAINELEFPESGECQYSYIDGTADTHYIIISSMVSEGDEPLYLHAAYDISDVYATQRFQQSTYLWVFGAAVLLCCLLSYFLSKLLTSPLEKLSRVSKEIASGQYSCRTQIDSGDEIGAVARDFNRMAAKMEQNIEELQEAVERQENFMGSFAHELKTPMTSIIGYSEMLYSENLTEAERAEAAQYIFSESKRLETLSRKLLQLLVVKKSALPLSSVSPKEIIEAMVAECQPMYQPVDLTCRCEEGICLIEPDLFRSLLLNLMDNARKAVDKNGAICIYQEMTPVGCRIKVCDNGRGIPEQALGRLTQPFYRVDKARSRMSGGTGLGLALCREIVRLHNGTLRFDSILNKGTCVVVELKGGRSCEP